MKFCRQCITPDTRPNIQLDATGLCNACATFTTKKEIDWARREAAFRDVVQNAKAKSRGYDCVIPVSGGKDSTWQVIKCLEYGLHPLTVTWKTPARTEVGARNLENLIHLGVDHIDYQINPEVEKKFMVETLVRYGSPAIPMHMAIYNIPPNIAASFGIPLVIWGENGAFEYGCSDEERRGFVMDQAWIKKHGVTHGLTADDFIGEGLRAADMTPYRTCPDQELKEKNILSIFLGYYFSWDPEVSLAVARSRGFEVSSSGPRTGFYNYADIDDEFISIHHYLKWYKFGFTRLFDNLSLEIRNGRMTRDQAVQIVCEKGSQPPLEDIRRFCRFVGIGTAHFFQLAERFRNPAIWKKQGSRWVLSDFLVKGWDWSEPQELLQMAAAKGNS